MHLGNVAISKSARGKCGAASPAGQEDKLWWHLGDPKKESQSLRVVPSHLKTSVPKRECPDVYMHTDT